MSEFEQMKNSQEGDREIKVPTLVADKPAQIAIGAALLDKRAFTAVNNAENPFKRGSLALLVVVGVVAAARFFGIGLDWLTMPRVDVVQQQILTVIGNTNYYANLVAETTEFADQFAATYANIWDLIRLLGGYPSTIGVVGVFLSPLGVLGSWLIFSSLSYFIARWFGTQVAYKRALGVLALAYAPILLTIIDIIPGAFMPLFLIFALTLITKFLAIRELYEFSPGQSLVVIVLPYVIGLILVIAVLLFAVAFGLNQFPVVDDVLRVLRFVGNVR
jgi:hypothetical protein